VQNRGLLYDADVVDACLELHAVGRSTSPNRDDK
jgi:hypothetical protein